MILDTNLKLEAVLAAAVATTQPEYHLDYRDWNREGNPTPPATSRGALNSTTDVTLLAAPGDNNPRREPLRLSIANRDTAAIQPILKTDDGTTERRILKVTLQVDESLLWQGDGTWQILGPDSVSALGTEVASTSGTSIDFTGIPSWVTQIQINFAGVSTNGTSGLIVQIGDAGGIETAGYLGSANLLTNGAAVVVTNFTTGFGVSGAVSAASVIHGTMTLTLEDATGFTWIASVNTGYSDAAQSSSGGGSKSTSAALDRVRITTVGGADTFDAGAINIRMT